jgi:hypothetical protein
VGIGSLLDKYKGSHSSLLLKVYPKYDWLPWKFIRCPHNYWDDLNNQKKFMDWAATQLNILEMRDWYKISIKVTFWRDRVCNWEQDLSDIGGHALLKKYKASVLRLLAQVFPEYDWASGEAAFPKLMSPSGKKSQFLLKSVLKTLFPKEGKAALLYY